MNDPHDPRPILAVGTDLIFETKIRSTAATLGIPVLVARSTQALAQHLESAHPCLILMDLNATGLDAAAAVAMACGHPTQPRVVAYGSHVDQALADAARKAGAHEVLPRSRFSAELPRILSTS